MLIVLWSTALQVSTCRQTMKPQINQPTAFYDKSCYFWLALYSSSWLNNIRELTDRFHVAMHLFSNRSQMDSKCGENKKRGTQATTRCHWCSYHSFFVICDLLWNRPMETRYLFDNSVMSWYNSAYYTYAGGFHTVMYSSCLSITVAISCAVLQNCSFSLCNCK